MPWWGWVLIVIGVVIIWRFLSRLGQGFSLGEALAETFFCSTFESDGGDSYDSFIDD
jgi:hypothetical protein